MARKSGGWTRRLPALGSTTAMTVVVTAVAALVVVGGTHAINWVCHRSAGSSAADLTLSIGDTAQPPPSAENTPDATNVPPSTGPPSAAPAVDPGERETDGRHGDANHGAGPGDGTAARLATPAAAMAGVGPGFATVTVSGLYPGVTTFLPVKLTNPNGFAITVTKLEGSLASTSATDCEPSRSNLIVGVFQGRPPLPATLVANEGRDSGVFALYMPNTVAEACQGTSFTIRLVGSATKT